MEASADYENRFGGIARLYGRDGLERLRKARVCVIGVGGVGSWTVEALARTGVGSLTMIDLDDVCVTNVNRQLPALDGQIGRPKVDVLADRVRAINPGCQISPVTEFFTAASAAELLAPGYDFVIDATDRVAIKSLIITSCRERNLKVLTMGGAGGKRDGTAIRVTDLAFSVQDEMLRQLRRMLRTECGCSSDPEQGFSVPCVYSPEKPMYPWADGTCSAQREPGGSLKMDCASGFGSVTHVTAAFGLAAAGEVIRRLTSK